MEFKSNWLGKCPFCNSEYLDYGNIQLEGDCCYFPWTCYGCGNHGEEWYNLNFTGHNVYVNNELIEIGETRYGFENENK